jgi:MSHA pilin protein MshD
MSSSRQLGLSLVEVVVFIVVLGIGLAGMAVIYNQLTLASVDPLVRKQAVAIANSLMEEVQLRPFTYCDPDDALVFTETSSTGCTAPAMRESGAPTPIGPDAGETRSGPATTFDNVSDYNGFQMLGSIQDINGNNIAGLTGYSASVAVAAAGGDFPAVPAPVPADDALLITVTVTGPANVRVELLGYRLRYAPNSP